MKTAIFSDTHGNHVVLEQCLAAMRDIGCEEFVCLGDSIGYFPDGWRCLESIDTIGATHLMGNHEAMLIGDLPLDPAADQVYGLSALRAELSGERRVRLTRMPKELAKSYGEREVLLVHGSPWEPLTGYIYEDTPETRWSDVSAALIFMGNTHRSYIRDLADGTTLINVGSIGLPRDIGNRSSFAVIDHETDSVTLHYLEFDTAEVLNRYPKVHPAVVSCLARRSTTQGGAE